MSDTTTSAAVPAPAPVFVREEIYGTTILPESTFRPNSKARNRIVNFAVVAGGIGDYICYLKGLLYVAENYPQLHGRVYVSQHMVELTEHFFEPHLKTWKIIDRATATEEQLKTYPLFAPTFAPINATGAHPLDLGFVYYASLMGPPAGYNCYPKLNLAVLDEIEPPPVKYAVMTPGATTANRTLRASVFNAIKDHLIARGVVPLFLGKKSITDVRRINYEEGYDYTGGLDFREKTTLLQAGGIISRAVLVVGLDNGLLHLGACTETPIVFGYNIASPEHRRPRRESGNIWEVYPDVKQLSCTFCQSRMRFMFDHDFANCLYGDSLCLDELAKPGPWIKAIDEILEKGG